MCFIFTPRRKLPVLFSTNATPMKSINRKLTAVRQYDQKRLLLPNIVFLVLCVLCFTLFVKQSVFNKELFD